MASNGLQSYDATSGPILARASASPDSGTLPFAQADHPRTPSSCGIMSRTVVESPVAQWILPAQVRNEEHNDVAFVGSRFVQITELLQDGQAHEVVRKQDFDSKIRSAAVIGEWTEPNNQSDRYGRSPDPKASPHVKAEITEPPNRRTWMMPPQILVLALESGVLVFLFIRVLNDGTPMIVTIEHRGPQNGPYLGQYLQVDPSSRYMVLAAPERFFIVYELESWQTLEAQYADRGWFQPVSSARTRAFHGVISHLTFLYPRPGDYFHIILLFIVARPERQDERPVCRIFVYDWEVGDDLKDVLSKNPIVQRLSDDYTMPIFLVPLTLQSAFFIVCENSIGFMTNLLAGSPDLEVLDTGTAGKTALHHGNREPLWAAWSRPFRRKVYFEKTDIVYLAREDGAIVHIEIDQGGPSVTNVGSVDTNIDTAFSAAYELYSDVLIASGSSGSGGIWKLPPRDDLQQVSTLPCWWPVADFASTISGPTQRTMTDVSRGARARRGGRHEGPKQADRLFSASGRGKKGNITEWRWGSEARIGLDIETGEPVRECWTFTIESRLWVLLALPHSSFLLRFEEGLGQVDAVAAEDTLLDLVSRTLCATQTTNDKVVQITERSVTLVTALESSQIFLGDILGDLDFKADYASCMNAMIVIATHDDRGSKLHILRHEGIRLFAVSSWLIDGDATCVDMSGETSSPTVIVASVKGGIPWLALYSTDGVRLVCSPLNNTNKEPNVLDAQDQLGHGDAIMSICVVRKYPGIFDIVAGTRSGSCLSIKVSDNTLHPISWQAEIYGVGPVTVAPAVSSERTRTAFVSCDDALVLLTDDISHKTRSRQKSFVWITESNDSSIPSAPIQFATCLINPAPAQKDHMSALLVSGSRLLLTDIGLHARHIPRSMPLHGTPTRLIYSHGWKCLIVALLCEDRPTLAFLDCKTGSVISSPVGRDQQPVDFISGLGQPRDRIFGLQEWKFIKDGKTFWFVLVTTKSGNLVVISVTPKGHQTQSSDTKRLLYSTRYRKRYDQPVYSIVGDADGLVYCVDRTVHWDVLDISEKRLKPRKQYLLESPVTSLAISNGMIVALTAMHSMHVLDHRSNGGSKDMTLVHADEVSRATGHMMDVSTTLGGPGGSTLTLLATHSGVIAAVGAPWGQTRRELTTLAEGVLQSPIRTFVRARRAPMLEPMGPARKLESLCCGSDKSDVLGVSVDGTLQHFTVLKMHVWQLLTLILYSSDALEGMAALELNKITTQHPQVMHVDGDRLAMVLGRHPLENIIASDQQRDVFYRCLDGLEGGKYTVGFRDGSAGEDEVSDRYFGLAYEVLEFVMSPIL